jgi:hypothetical protein
MLVLIPLDDHFTTLIVLSYSQMPMLAYGLQQLEQPQMNARIGV